MSSNFEKTESHVSQALKEHPDSTRAFSNELHDLQRRETKGAFKQDLGKLNDDLHKQGMLPGLQIVENEKTHEFELKKIANSGNQNAPEKAAPADNGQEGERPARPGHAGGGGAEHHGGGEHHAGRHGHNHGRHRHHKHHAGGKGADKGDASDASDDSDANDKGNDKPDVSDGKSDKGTPDQGKAGKSSDGSKVAADGSNMSKDEKEKYIFNRLTDNHEGGLHLTKAQAAGVIGNLESESKNLYSGYTDHKKPVVEHDLGFANWTKERKAGLEDFAKGQGKSPTDFKTQVDFMVDELKTREHGATKKDALADLRNTTTVAGAAKVFAKEYERPMAKYAHMGDRINNAQLAFANMGRWDEHINDNVAYLGDQV
jgi:hypothetical protein